MADTYDVQFVYFGLLQVEANSESEAEDEAEERLNLMTQSELVGCFTDLEIAEVEKVELP